MSTFGRSPWRHPGRSTGLGRARGRHQTLLIATCLALVLAAVGDEAPGYDGPGSLIALAVAGLVALVRWQYTPLLAAVLAIFFLVGGFSQPSFVDRLFDPGHALVFAAGWLQMLSFAATAIFAVTAVAFARPGTVNGHARRAIPIQDPPALRGRGGAMLSRLRPIKTTRASRLGLRHPRPSTWLSLAGLLVGIVGLGIQWFADPSKFADAQRQFGISFPPGIVFIVVCGVLMLATSRWRWHPIFAVATMVWIVGVGTLVGELTPNLLSANVGTAAGNAVMTAGLVLAGVGGIYGISTAGRTPAPARPQG